MLEGAVCGVKFEYHLIRHIRPLSDNILPCMVKDLFQAGATIQRKTSLVQRGIWIINFNLFGQMLILNNSHADIWAYPKKHIIALRDDSTQLQTSRGQTWIAQFCLILWYDRDKTLLFKSRFTLPVKWAILTIFVESISQPIIVPISFWLLIRILDSQGRAYRLGLNEMCGYKPHLKPSSNQVYV